MSTSTEQDRSVAALAAAAVFLAAVGLWALLWAPGADQRPSSPPDAATTSVAVTLPSGAEPTDATQAPMIPRPVPTRAPSRGVVDDQAVTTTSAPGLEADDDQAVSTAGRGDRFTPLAAGDNEAWVEDWVPHDDHLDDADLPAADPGDDEAHEPELEQLQRIFRRHVPTVMAGWDEVVDAARAGLDADLAQARLGSVEHRAAVVITPDPAPPAEQTLLELDTVDVGLYVQVTTTLDEATPRIYQVTITRVGDQWQIAGLRLI